MKSIKNKLFQSPIFLSFGVSFLIFFILLLFSGILKGNNISFQYWFSGVKNQISQYKVDKKIIIVEIDNETLNQFGFPMDRSLYAPVIDNLSQAGVASIGIDIIFEDPSNTISDKNFSDAIERSGKVLLGFSSIDNAPRKILDIFSKHITATGFFDLQLDVIGGVHSIITSKKLRDKQQYDYFPIAVLKQARESQVFYMNQKILVQFLPRKSFIRASFASVYDPVQFNSLSKQISFQDAIVLIGMTADGTKDIFKTPNGQDYGVYVHANTINTLLQGYSTTYFSLILERCLLFLVLLVACYLNFTRRGWGLVTSNIAVATIFLMIFPAAILVFTNLLPNLYIEFLLGLILVLIISNIARYLLENKDKKKLNIALGEYVSKEISAEILSGKGEVNFDGEKKQIGMFFSDIEGFTSISEKFSPEKLVFFLREYLGEMSHIIMDNRGFINKYEGDAIMALWGAFGKNDNIVYNACFSAIEQQKALSILNKKWSQEDTFDRLKVRMGIHIGEAILGNIGAAGRKLEFTALGDNVNLASRLEGINKYYNTYICVSEDVYNQVQDSFDFRYLDNIRVKGKNKPIKIYELLSLKGKTIAEHKSIITQFNEAIDLYYGQDFKGSYEIFKKLSQLGDGPSKTYLERTQEFIQNPPGNDWDRIWTFSSK